MKSIKLHSNSIIDTTSGMAQTEHQAIWYICKVNDS